MDKYKYTKKRPERILDTMANDREYGNLFPESPSLTVGVPEILKERFIASSDANLHKGYDTLNKTETDGGKGITANVLAFSIVAIGTSIVILVLGLLF